MNIKQIPKEEWENCLNCDNTGAIPHHICGGDEIVCQTQCPDWEQCEFCYTNPKSVFNQKRIIKGDKMITKKSWNEFRKSGLLLFINQILHVFGWAIVFDFETYDKEIDDGEIKDVYPARVKFRGLMQIVYQNPMGR